jgi:hypothetical protein
MEKEFITLIENYAALAKNRFETKDVIEIESETSFNVKPSLKLTISLPDTGSILPPLDDFNFYNQFYDIYELGKNVGCEIEVLWDGKVCEFSEDGIKFYVQ